MMFNTCDHNCFTTTMYCTIVVTALLYSTVSGQLSGAEVVELEINTIIRKLRQAQIDNDTNCFAMTQFFLTRLDVLDVDLHSIVYVNEEAVNIAAELDGAEVSPGKLHCIPVVVADNIPVKDMPMSLGLNVFSEYAITFSSGPVVSALQTEGAIILGKSNVEPLGLPGIVEDKEHKKPEVANPYGPEYRTSYGNGGVAAAVAARLAVIGVGSDTGGDGLVAASDSNVVAVRPPSSLVSFDTLFPTVVYQDAITFYALNVKDIAVVLDAVTGQTLPYFTVFEPEQAKILTWGVLTNMTWTNQINLTYPNANITWNVDPLVRGMVSTMVQQLADKGIVVQNTSVDLIPTLSRVLPYQNQISACFSDWISSYWSGHSMEATDAQGPIRSFDALIKRARLPDESVKLLQQLLSQKNNCSKANANLLGARQKLRAVFDPIFEEIDMVMFPATISSPSLVIEKQVTLNVTFGSHYPGAALPAVLGYPAITLPIAFRDDEPGAPNGLPVSVILMSKPSNFKFLLQAARFYQSELSPNLRKQVPSILQQSAYSNMISSSSTTCDIAVFFVYFYPVFMWFIFAVVS